MTLVCLLGGKEEPSISLGGLDGDRLSFQNAIWHTGPAVLIALGHLKSDHLRFLSARLARYTFMDVNVLRI